MSDTDLNLLFSSIAALAVLLYLAPGVLRLSPQARRLTEPLAIGLVGVGMIIGLILWVIGNQ